jgi:hypothetical protein
MEAIRTVAAHAESIYGAAQRYGVAAEAIAGAILWDALENPYTRRFWRLGPGKVHPVELAGDSEAESVESEGLVLPPARSGWHRLQRLREPVWAITYIAAILRRHADTYERIAGLKIANDPGVLCTLYQGGGSEERARRLAARRAREPNAAPIPGDEMGPWVADNVEFIRAVLSSRCPAGAPNGTREPLGRLVPVLGRPRSPR